ncbi:MAG: hypothetical protein AAF694_15720 [Bacteroidota bacterium]
MKNFDRIFAYHEGELSSKEKSQFEEDLKKDEELALENEIYKFGDEATLLAVVDEVMGKNKKAQEPAANVKAIRPSQRGFRTYAVGGSIAAAVILLVGFFFGKSQYSNPKIASSQYKLPLTDVLKGNQEDKNNELNLGKKALYEGAYGKAIATFNAIPKAETKTYLESQYWLGHAYYNTGEYGSAIKSFEALVQPDSLISDVLQEEARWNLLLARISQGLPLEEVQKELSYFTQQGTGNHRNAARSLQKTFESAWYKLFGEG